MANLTLSIDDDLLRRARMRALELDTTVNAMVRDYLAGLAGANPTKQAISDFLELADQVSTSSGPKGHDWSREDLYER